MLDFALIWTSGATDEQMQLSELPSSLARQPFACLTAHNEANGRFAEAVMTSRSDLPNSLATRMVPLFALGLLLLAGIVKVGGPRVGQNFDGVVVEKFPLYEFYPDVKGCPIKGTPYWLAPNDNLREQMVLHLNHLDQGAWRVKFHGNLSRWGRYGYGDRYWREVRVVGVYRVVELDCGASQ